MNIKYSLKILFASLLFVGVTFSQTEDSIEVYIIDAYVKPELPHTLILSFFTSDYCKSTLIIDERYTYEVSKEFNDMHKTEIDISDLKFNSKIVDFIIRTETESGKEYTSEIFDFDLPYEPEIEGGSELLQLCLFGGAVFLLPYPDLILKDAKSYWALTKDIPILSFRSSNLNYPGAYISVAYTYILESDENNFLRAAYKRIFELDFIEFVSPGISAYTNFSGNNGIGIEVSAGLFTIANTFTVYSRYRYNFKPGDGLGNFQEVSIGLYSAFFSIYLK